MAAQAGIWEVPGDFATIQAAIDSQSVAEGDEILVAPGHYNGATVSKPVVLKGSDETVISDGPKPWSSRDFNAGFMFRGPSAEKASGASIINFTFEDVDFPVFASQKGAVISRVTVQRCTMRNAIQAITMWHADEWDVRYNRIVDLEAVRGGGIGILVGSYFGDAAFENIVSDNEIVGTVYIDPADKGGYDAAGVFLVSDHRGPKTGGVVMGNLIEKNKIALKSEDSALVPVVGIQLTDTRVWVRVPDIEGNTVRGNDITRAEHDVTLEPVQLDDSNDVQ